MVGWPHRHSGHEFEPTHRESGGQGSLVGCSPWGHKEWDTTTEQQSVRCLQERMLQGQGGQGAVGSPAWAQSGTDGRERMLQGQALGNRGGEPCLGAERDGRQRADAPGPGFGQPWGRALPGCRAGRTAESC